MSVPLPLRKISERLLAYETGENLTHAARSPAAHLVCAKLRPSLAALMGDGGYRALLVRALTLAGADMAWPSVVQVSTNGTLHGLDQSEALLGRKEFAEASAVLVTQLLGLLVAFIGEELTFRLLREIWPEVPLKADQAIPGDIGQ